MTSSQRSWARALGAVALALVLLAGAVLVLVGCGREPTPLAFSVYEDGAHTSGDRGTFVLGVRNDTVGTLASADGDYSPLTVDASGRLWAAIGNTDDITVTLDGEIVSVDATGQGDVPISTSRDLTVTLDSEAVDVTTSVDFTVTLDSEVVAADVTGQGDVPITLDSEVVSVAASADLTVTLDSEAVVLGASGGTDIGDVDVASIAAGETHLGEVGTNSDVISVTLSLDTSQYASGDVLAATQALTDAMRVLAGTGIWYSMMVQDLDDQAGALDVVLLDANCSIGTENAAVSIADSCADNILCVVEVISADYVDMVNSQLALKSPDCLAEATAGIDELWFGVVSRDTITYTASGIVLQFGFLRD